MSFRFLSVLAPLLALASVHANAQTAPHPLAEQALERIVLERDFGAELRFHSREVITIEENDKVPGLNGLMFMRWRGTDPATELIASVQWFEKTSDLLSFYRAETSRNAQGLLSVGDTLIWKTGKQSYLWTDGEHFVVGLGGSTAPPKEMLEAWLGLVESKLPDLARVPAAFP